MFKKWMHLFSKEKQEVRIKIEKESAKKSILDIVDKKEVNKTEEKDLNKDLNKDLMDEILKFRKDTSSLDYLRNEIEQVLHQKDGEVKLMKGFADAMKQQKK